MPCKGVTIYIINEQANSLLIINRDTALAEKATSITHTINSAEVSQVT